MTPVPTSPIFRLSTLSFYKLLALMLIIIASMPSAGHCGVAASTVLHLELIATSCYPWLSGWTVEQGP